MADVAVDEEELRQVEERLRVNQIMIASLMGLVGIMIVVAISLGVHFSRKIDTLQQNTVTRALRVAEHASERFAAANTGEKLATTLATALGRIAERTK